MRGKALLLWGAVSLLALGGGVARADDDAAAGAAVFKRTCGICHTVEAGKNRIGPSLFAIVGRKSGTAPNFNYSEAMKTAGKTWDADTIDLYLTDPKGFVPNNKMAFPGLKKPEERKAVIAYLSTLK